jgi:O-acetyl-ADP-ribose deacetylase (regulator of RNase III)
MAAELHIIRGDITRQTVDAIVNAANAHLEPGGGVCGAIHAAAGPDLARACRALGGCPTGQAKITPGFQLPARYVIHAVGPVWQGGTANEDVMLASCYQASLALMDADQLHTIAFPSISTGIYGFPLDRAAPIAVAAVRDYLAAHPASKVTDVTWVCFDERTFQAYQAAVAG